MHRAFQQARLASTSSLSSSQRSISRMDDDEERRLVKILRDKVACKTRTTSTSRRTLEVRFRELDCDKNGVLSEKEFVKGVSPYLQGIPGNSIRQLFLAFDTDSNGELTVDEFITQLLEEPVASRKAARAVNAKARKSSQKMPGSRPGSTESKFSRASTPRGRALREDAASKAPYFRGDPRPASRSTKVGNRDKTDKSVLLSAPRMRAMNRAVDTLREKIIERGGTTGLLSLQRVMRIMDDSGDMKLSKEELKYGLRDYGIRLDPEDFSLLFTYFDMDGSGSITFSELMLGLAPPMSERRIELVDKAFDIMDNTGDGIITVDDMSKVYNVSMNPEVISGRVTEEQALRQLLDHFDSDEKDGKVTREEFRAYYQRISSSIDADEYFELMMRNAWHMSGGKGSAANTTCRRVLVTHVDGTQSVEEITDDLGIAADDIATMKKNLRRRGIDAKAIKTFGSVAKKKKSAMRRRKVKSTSRQAPYAVDPSIATMKKKLTMKRDEATTTPVVVVNPPLQPTPSEAELRPIMRRLRSDILQRSHGKSHLLSSADRLQFHTADLQIRLSAIILQKVLARYRRDAEGKLSCKDFGFALRAFNPAGAEPLSENDVVMLWRSCSGGDPDLFLQHTFARRRQKGEDIFYQRQDGKSGRPEVAWGPFDSAHYGERVVQPIESGSVPMRMRYRYSRTPVQPPSSWDTSEMTKSAQLPPAELRLERIYGANGSISNSLCVSSRGELVFPIAATVVVQESQLSDDVQRFFIAHDDDITCLAVDPSGSIAASGQMGKNPRVIVWNIASFEVCAVIGQGFFERSVCAVGFAAENSSYIVGIGCDDHHALGVWKWKLSKSEQEGLELHGKATPGQPTPGRLIGESASQNGTPPQIHQLILPPRNRARSKSSTLSFATCGISHLKLWSVSIDPKDKRRPISSRNTRYGRAAKQPRQVRCGMYLNMGNNDDTTRILFTGGSNGYIYAFDAEMGQCLQSMQAHDTACTVLARVSASGKKGNQRVISGGSDAKLHVWTARLATRGKSKIELIRSATIDLSSHHRASRRLVKAANLDQPDTIIAPSDYSKKISFKSKKSRPPAGDPSAAARSEKKSSSSSRRKSSAALSSSGWSGKHCLRAVATDPMNSFTWYALTSRGDIWAIDSRTGKATRKAASHFGPVYGVAAHPTRPNRFATSGEDGLACVWDAGTHKLVASLALPAPARSCAWAPDGLRLAIGFVNGGFTILRFQKATGHRPAALIIDHMGQDRVEIIDDIKFSPDGQWLAVASHDNLIDLYNTRENYTKVATCKGHTSYITHIDFSKDSTVLRSNCGAYEIIYWNVPSGKPILSSTDRVEADTAWASCNCVLGFGVMGIWPEYSDGTDVNSVDKSSDGHLLVTGDDFGGVKLFNAPCVVQHAPARRYAAHSSHVSGTRFLMGSEKVISVGGWDRAVMMWTVDRSAGAGRGKTKWKPLTAWRNA
eukprot:g4136.t1